MKLTLTDLQMLTSARTAGAAITVDDQSFTIDFGEEFDSCISFLDKLDDEPYIIRTYDVFTGCGSIYLKRKRGGH